MFRREMSIATAIFAALLALPMLARNAAAKDPKPTNVTMDILSPTSLGGTALKPGSYQVRAGDAKVTLELNGKVVAEAPVHWKDGASKAKYSAIVTDGHGVKEIHFGGKSEYVEIAE